MLSALNLDTLTIFDINKPLYIKFIIGTIFALAPIIYIVIRFLVLWKKNELKEALNLKNWSFIAENSNDTINQDISEENERSSIEFEKYFYDILKIILNGKNKEKPYKQIVLIIDNLDRINADDSLKIWSTIQTFLQYKNPNNKPNLISKNLWVIVPYDECGLGKLWNNENYKSEKKIKKETQESSIPIDNTINNDGEEYHSKEGNLQTRSFFDKCFQLRFEIPFPVQTSWEIFAKQQIQEAFNGSNTNQTDLILNILKNTRDSLADIPSPREIKTYINQIGVQQMLSDESITIDCIAYYVYLKYLIQLSQEDIKQNLLLKEIPFKQHKLLLNQDSKAQIAGIIFGVKPSTGAQLLLEAPILDALNSGSDDTLFKLFKIHQNGFWSIYNYIITKYFNDKYGSNKINLLKASKAICEDTWKEVEEARNFDKLKQEIKKSSYNYPTLNNYDFYKSLFLLFDKDENDFKNLWENMLKSFQININSELFNPEEAVTIYNNLCIDFPKQSRSKVEIKITNEDLNIANWQNWANYFNNEIIYLIPEEKTLALIAKEIKTGVQIKDIEINFIKYLIKAKNYDFNFLIAQLKNHFMYNNGADLGQFISPKVLDIMIELAIKRENNKSDILTFLETPQVFNFIGYNITYINEIALLIAICNTEGIVQFRLKNNIDKSNMGLVKAKNIWLNEDTNTVESLMNTLEKYKKETIIWSMSFQENKQIKNILKIAIKNKKTSYFNINQDCYSNFQNAIKILDSEQEKNDLTTLLILNTRLEENIKTNIKFQENIKNLVYLNLILNCEVTNKKTNDSIINYIYNLKQEDWLEVFHDEMLFNIIQILFNNKSIQINKLKSPFSLSLCKIIEEWAKKNKEPIGLLKQNWSNILLKLNVENLKTIKSLIKELIFMKYDDLDINFLEANINIINNIIIDNTNFDFIKRILENLFTDDSLFINRLNKLEILFKVIKINEANKSFNENILPTLESKIKSENESIKSKMQFIAQKLGINELNKLE